MSKKTRSALIYSLAVGMIGLSTMGAKWSDRHAAISLSDHRGLGSFSVDDLLGPATAAPEAPSLQFKGDDGQTTPVNGASSETTDSDWPGFAPVNEPTTPPLPVRNERPQTQVSAPDISKALEPPHTRNQGRDMYQMPPGVCGSFTYNPNGGRAQPSAMYAHPVTGCAFTAFLQEWNQKCEQMQGGKENNRRGCRIAWGHISHNKYKGKSRHWGHQTHTHGYCIDIRPLRSGNFANAPLRVGQAGYSWNYTKEMLKLAKKYGSDVVYFNESRSRRRSVGASYSAGHHNHVHICFKPGSGTRRACKKWEPNYNVCPSAKGWVKMLERRGLK